VSDAQTRKTYAAPQSLAHGWLGSFHTSEWIAGAVVLVPCWFVVNYFLPSMASMLVGSLLVLAVFWLLHALRRMHKGRRNWLVPAVRPIPKSGRLFSVFEDV
jgi:hypothetical protein